TRGWKIRICRKTGKYRDRTSQRVLRRKRGGKGRLLCRGMRAEVFNASPAGRSASKTRINALTPCGSIFFARSHCEEDGLPGQARQGQRGRRPRESGDQ